MSASEHEDADGNHPASNVPVENLHFNVLKVLRNAKQEFETKNNGKVARFCYAPEPLLYLVDRAVKVRALNSGSVPEEVLAQATVTQVFGMELISIGGTCITITSEAVHTEEDIERPQPIVVPPQNGQLPN